MRERKDVWKESEFFLKKENIPEMKIEEKIGKVDLVRTNLRLIAE